MTALWIAAKVFAAVGVATVVGVVVLIRNMEFEEPRDEA